MLAQLANSSLECIENSLTIQKSTTRKSEYVVHKFKAFLSYGCPC